MWQGSKVHRKLKVTLAREKLLLQQHKFFSCSGVYLAFMWFESGWWETWVLLQVALG
jgi:hypothetical protein